jgi:hypothetical protein
MFFFAAEGWEEIVFLFFVMDFALAIAGVELLIICLEREFAAAIGFAEEGWSVATIALAGDMATATHHEQLWKPRLSNNQDTNNAHHNAPPPWRKHDP